MGISSRVLAGAMTVALVAPVFIFATGAHAQHRGNVVPGSPGPSGPTPTEGTTPMLSGGITYNDGDPPPSVQDDPAAMQAWLDQQLQQDLGNLQNTLQQQQEQENLEEQRELNRVMNPIFGGAPGFHLGGPIGLSLYSVNGFAG